MNCGNAVISIITTKQICALIQKLVVRLDITTNICYYVVVTKKITATMEV